MPLAQIAEPNWTIDSFHGVSGSKLKWKITPQGILVENEPSPRLFSAQVYKDIPKKVLDNFSDPIQNACQASSLPFKLIAATICTESAGNPSARRYESNLKDYSFGLTQTLTNTAFYVANSLGFPKETVPEAKTWKLPSRPIPQGGSLQDWQTFLFNPLNSILIGSGYHQINNNKFSLQTDPVLLYASYNAGSPRLSTLSPWGLVNYGAALEGFVRFYNEFSSFLP